MRDTPDPVSVARAEPVGTRVDNALREWSAEPWAFDYFAVLRRLESIAATTPRWGRALLPNAEPVRVGQEPSLSCAPASFSRVEPATA